MTTNRAQQKRNMKKVAKRKARVKTLKQREIAERRKDMRADIIDAVNNIRDDIIKQVIDSTANPCDILVRLKMTQGDDSSWSNSKVTLLPPMKTKRTYVNTLSWDDNVTVMLKDTGKVVFCTMREALDGLFSVKSTEEFDEFISCLAAEGKVDLKRILKRGDSYIQDLAAQYHDC